MPVLGLPVQVVMLSKKQPKVTPKFSLFSLLQGKALMPVKKQNKRLVSLRLV